MTLATLITRAEGVANGATIAFPFGGKIISEADLIVEVLDADGAADLQELDVDYTVSGAGDDAGCAVTFTLPPATGTVVIRRLLDLEQSTDIRNSPRFYPETHEEVFDALVMIDQQQQEEIERSLRKPVHGDQFDADNIRIENLAAPIANTDAARLQDVINAGGDGVGVANLVAVSDAGAHFAGANVEAVLQEVGEMLEEFEVDGVVPRHIRTLAEIAAGVTPTNEAHAEARIPRYATNETPGTTDVTAAFTNALAVVRNRDSITRGETVAPAGRYKLTSGLDPATRVDLVGEGRHNTRLEFALADAGPCVDLKGTDTGNRLSSSVRRIRIDGTNCTHASAVGVELEWNQGQQPILDEVTIYGGYEAAGASTGLKHGLVFKTDGNNWITSLNELAIEGCHGDQFVMDTADGGAITTMNYWGGRIENGAERNVVIMGPDDDVFTVQVNFFGTVIESASFGNTGVNANVHVEGAVSVNFSHCYFESLGSPNWPTYEIYCPSGNLHLDTINIAHSQTGIYCGGTVTLSGLCTLRSSTACIHIPAGGKCIIRGDVRFHGSGAAFTFATGGQLEWARENVVDKAASYAILTSDLCSTFTNSLAVQNITFTLPAAPGGATATFVNRGVPVRNSQYRWVLSGSGSGEYYLQTAAGGNPGLSEPAKFYRSATERTKGAAGTLSNLQWGWGNNDSLGYNTIYYRDAGADPDTFSDNTLFAVYALTITPTTYRIVPTGDDGGDSISTSQLGASIKLRSMSGAFWFEESKTGTWA